MEDVKRDVLELFKQLGKEWMVLLFLHITSEGPITYNELNRLLNKSISPSLLSMRLKKMQDMKLIERRKLDGRIKYYPTKTGIQLKAKLMGIKDWAVENGYSLPEECSHPNMKCDAFD